MTNNIDDLKFLEGFLAYNLANCQVWDDGAVIETRHRIAEVNGVKISIYSNEHPPHHFHVEYGEYKASFLIESGKLYKGNFPSKERKIVEYWYNNNLCKEKLIKKYIEVQSDTSCLKELTSL